MSDRIQATRQVTGDRYTQATNGDVWDHWAGHYISATLWRTRISEGRSDRQRHRFEYLHEKPVSVGGGYYLQPVQCTRCGERRDIGCAVDQLNRQERWCLALPTLRQLVRRLFGEVEA